MRTSYKKQHVPIVGGKGNRIANVNPGQFIFGRNTAARSLNVSPSTVWDRMKKLEMMEVIKIASNNQFSIVTISNWMEYQVAERGDPTPSRHATNKQPTTNQQVTDTYKKDKKEKNNNRVLDFDPIKARPEWISKNDWNDLVLHRKSHPEKLVESKRAYDAIITQFEIAGKEGFSVADCIDRIANSSWRGFQAKWMKGTLSGKSVENQRRDCKRCTYFDRGSCNGGRPECTSFVLSPKMY